MKVTREYCAIATSDGKAWIVHGGKLGDVICYDENSAETIVTALNDQILARNARTLQRASSARDALDKLIDALEGES